MVKYAQKECRDCHAVLPANEMYRSSERFVKSQTFFGPKKDNSSHMSHRADVTEYATRAVFLCPSCKQRRDRRHTQKLLLIVGAIFAVIGLYLYLMATAKMTPLSTDEISPTEAATPASNAIEAETTVPPQEKNINEAPANILPMPQIGQPQPTTDDGTDLEQNDAAIAAFISGQPTRWISGSLQGYAVPSEEVAGCRNITISTDGDQTASRLLKQCK